MHDDPRLVSSFPFRANAVIIRLPHLCEVTLIDISVHGALVWMKGNVEFKVGDETRLRVLNEKGNQAFEVPALVAHRAENMVGLEFSVVDQHARNTMDRLIDMNLGTLELAMRTLPVLLKANPVATPTAA